MSSVEDSLRGIPIRTSFVNEILFGRTAVSIHSFLSEPANREDA